MSCVRKLALFPFLKSKLKTFLILFFLFYYVCEGFVCVYVCVSLACLVTVEARRGPWILWNGKFKTSLAQLSKTLYQNKKYGLEIAQWVKMLALHAQGLEFESPAPTLKSWAWLCVLL